MRDRETTNPQEYNIPFDFRERIDPNRVATLARKFGEIYKLPEETIQRAAQTPAFRYPLLSDKKGLYSILPDGSKEILVAQTLTKKEEEEFTLAHELAHAIGPGLVIVWTKEVEQHTAFTQNTHLNEAVTNVLVLGVIHGQHNATSFLDLIYDRHVERARLDGRTILLLHAMARASCGNSPITLQDLAEAYFSGARVLDFYRRIIKSWPNNVNPGMKSVFELLPWTSSVDTEIPEPVEEYLDNITPVKDYHYNITWIDEEPDGE